MPMPHKGKRIAINVRLPYDEYYEVANRAKRRDWSMSQYIAWCVARELGSRRVRGRKGQEPRRVANLGLVRDQFDDLDEDFDVTSDGAVSRSEDFDAVGE